MLTPQFTSTKKPDNVDIKSFNSGIFFGIEDSGAKIGHNGSDPGVSTEMYYYPHDDVGVIILIIPM